MNYNVPVSPNLWTLKLHEVHTYQLSLSGLRAKWISWDSVKVNVISKCIEIWGQEVWHHLEAPLDICTVPCAVLWGCRAPWTYLFYCPPLVGGKHAELTRVRGATEGSHAAFSGDSKGDWEPTGAAPVAQSQAAAREHGAGRQAQQDHRAVRATGRGELLQLSRSVSTPWTCSCHHSH